MLWLYFVLTRDVELRVSLDLGVDIVVNSPIYSTQLMSSVDLSLIMIQSSQCFVRTMCDVAII